MIRFPRSILLILTIVLMISCKKKNNDSSSPNPNDPTPPVAFDFTISSFPNQTGNQWIYVNIVSTSVCGVPCGTCCSSYTNSYTSTVTVIADTLVGGNPGKIWLTQSDLFADYKSIGYLNPSANLFYIIPLDSTKGLRSTSFKIPLTKNQLWQNKLLIPSDTSYSKDIEQYYNGHDYYNIINAERKSDLLRQDYYKVNTKGLIYRKNISIFIQTVQMFYVETQVVLVTTNF